MFVETVTQPRDEGAVERASADARRSPQALIASIVWEAGDGLVTALNVWDSAEAVADFFVERVHAVIQADGEPATRPTRRGEPLAVYLRGVSDRP